MQKKIKCCRRGVLCAPGCNVYSVIRPFFAAISWVWRDAIKVKDAPDLSLTERSSWLFVSHFMKLLPPLLLLLISQIAMAQEYSQGGSAWCLVQDETEICGYNTADDCYDAALGAGGYCRENARHVGMSGEQYWCVVDATGRDCKYYYQDQCMNEAVNRNGGCVYNTELALRNTMVLNDVFSELDVVEEAGQKKLADQLRDTQSENSKRDQAAQRQAEAAARAAAAAVEQGQ